jgi:4-oxalocrotonate tautomerase
MQVITIHITNERLHADSRRALIDGCIRLVEDILCKQPGTTVVTIDEMHLDDIGMGGVGITEYRERFLA